MSDGTNAAGTGTPADRLLPTWRHAALLYAIWLVPALVFTGTSAPQSELTFAAWLTAFGVALWYWFYWASITPAIYRLVVAFPPLGPRSAAGLAIHTVAALAFGVFGLAIYLAVVRRWVLFHDYTFPELVGRELAAGSPLARHLLNFGKYWLVVGAMSLIREARLRRRSERLEAAARLRAARLESELAAATLQALRARLDPHFLFNALNSVGALVEQGENRRAFRMIGVLGALLRATLQPAGEQRISLTEEVALVRRYLELEELRFGDRLTATIDLPAECEGALVPSLVLQPLVENAVRHGVARRVEPVRVRIAARGEAGRLLLTVEDDGPGLPAGWNLAHDAGVGLRTTAERLALLYGADHRFDVAPVPGGGVCSTLDLPWEPAGAEPPEEPAR